MDSAEAARQQAQRDHNWNQGPANTTGWNATARATYEAERAQLQQKQWQDANGKKGG